MSRPPSAHLVGISHHTADVGVRERLALSADDMARRLEVEAAAGRSLILLSTCNRLELYWWGDADQEPHLRRLAAERGVALDCPLLYRRDGPAALRHLFTVAAGLDSQVVGELEILGQVRRAHQLAAAAGATTWELDLAFAAALAAGRRARRDTMLGRHPASVSGAALEHAARCLGGSLAGVLVLVLGAGEVAGGVLRALEGRGAARVAVLSRRRERGARLAAAVPGANAQTAGWDRLADEMSAADLVFAAIGSRRPVLDAAALTRIMASRPDRGLVVLDLGVPRNIEPAARDVAGVRLFDLDDLRLQHCPAVGPAAPALEEVGRILERELARLDRALHRRAASPELAELHRFGAVLAREEAERALAELGALSEEKSAVVRRMAERLARRLLYPASRTMWER
ncbi:MAG: glutamyl-tRNA reductase [Gemmatimonadales bacterium]